jgi:hypothetical protein
LEGVRVEELQSHFLERADETNVCMEILTSGLIEVVAFAPALLSLELLQICIDHYDIRSKSILNKGGEPVVSISRETIYSVLCLPESTFATFSPIQSLAEYRESPNNYHNILARKWTETNYGGGSRLPKVITKDRMKPYIHDLVVLLHRVKGSANVFLFEEWMFHYIEIILKGEQYMDWATIIANSMRSQLKWAKESKEVFYMASYLTYYIAYVSNIAPLTHEVWNEEMTIYQYYPLLQRDNVLENFRKVHDVLIESVYVTLKKAPMPRLSSEAQKLIQKYESYFIQLPKFTYLRVGGFEDEPLNLSLYALDCFILAELCRKLFSVVKDNLPQEDWESIFPIKLNSLVCSSMVNASVIGTNLLGFGFGSFQGRRKFDSKGFAIHVLGLKGRSPIVPHLEDLWKDWENEKEVLIRDHSRLTLQ